MIALAILSAVAFVVALVLIAACNREVDDAAIVEQDIIDSTDEPAISQSDEPATSQADERAIWNAPPLPSVGFEGFEQWDDRVAAYEELLTQGASEQTAIVDIFGPKAEKPEGAEYRFWYSIFDCNNIWVLVDFVDDSDYDRNVELIKEFLVQGEAPWPENDDPEWQMTQEHGRVRAAIPIALLRSLGAHPEVEEIYFSIPTDFAIPI